MDRLVSSSTEQLPSIPDLLAISPGNSSHSDVQKSLSDNNLITINGKDAANTKTSNPDSTTNTSDEHSQFVWCEECAAENIGECFIHGGHLTIALDNEMPSRAVLSLPKLLTLKQVKDDTGASLETRGVFAKRLIKARTLFGPLEAGIFHSEHQNMDMDYQLKIADGQTVVLDTTDENKCNWMIFVRSAENFAQQNVSAFQKDEHVFFVTCKDIYTGVELRVWYAAAYAKAIGKRILIPVPEKESKDAASQKNTKKRVGRPPRSVLSANVPKFIKTDDGTDLVTDRSSRTSEFTCNTCNTSFERLALLDSHVCVELGELPDPNIVDIKRRRGRPPKIFADSLPVVVTGQHGDRMPLNQAKEADSEEASMPSESLIPTTAAMLEASPEEDNYTQTMLKRGRGRPKGKQKKNSPRKKVGSYSCSVCKKIFSSKEECLEHEASHGKPPYKCPVDGCDKVLNSKFKYQRHAIVHEKPNHLSCRFCSSTFNRIDHLKNHMLIHDKNRDVFTCDICGKSYLYKSTLMFHKAKHLAEESDRLNCLICETVFESKQELHNHLKIHNRYKPVQKPKGKHQCPKCGKQLATAKDIRRHMVTHTKERPFLCEHCPQTFVRKDHLRRHYTSNHKKEFYIAQRKDSPFGCDVCQVVFQKKEFYDYHMKSAHPQGLPVMEECAPNSQSKPESYTIEILGSASSEPGDVQASRTMHVTVAPLQKRIAPKTKVSLLKQTVSKLAPNPSPIGVVTSGSQSQPYPVSICWKSGPQGHLQETKISSTNVTTTSSKISSTAMITTETVNVVESSSSAQPLTQQWLSQNPVALSPEEALAELCSAVGSSVKSRELSILELQELLRQTQPQTEVGMQSQNMNPNNLLQQALALQQLNNHAQEESLSMVQGNVPVPSSHQPTLPQVLQPFQPVTLLTHQNGQGIPPQFCDQGQQQQQPQQLPQHQKEAQSDQYLQQHHHQQQQQQPAQQLMQFLQVPQGQKQHPHLLQSIQKLNNIGGLSQSQDSGQSTGANPSVVNIIGVKPFQWKLVKDQGNTFLLPPQQQQVQQDQLLQQHQPPQNQLIQQDAFKTADATCIITANGQVLRANNSNPDHCYATAVSVATPQLNQLLNPAAKVTSGSGASQLVPTQNPKRVSGPNLADEETTRIIAEISKVGLATNLVPTLEVASRNQTFSSSTTNLHSKQQHQQQQQQQSPVPHTELVQQQLQQHAQQQDLKIQLEIQQQLQQRQQQQQQQQQSQQSSDSAPLLWTENMADYSLLSEVSLPSDIQFLSAPDATLVSAGPGPLRSGTNWILQLAAQSALDSQQQQQQQQIIVVPASTSSGSV